jgi:hypothetical protein
MGKYSKECEVKFLLNFTGQVMPTAIFNVESTRSLDHGS